MRPSAPTAPRLSIFLPYLEGGGAERVMLWLAHRFAEKGVSVDVVVADRRGPLVDTISDCVHLVPLGQKRTALALPALVRYLRTESPQAILTGLTHSNVVVTLAARIARRPRTVVITEHTDLAAAQRLPESGRARFLPRLAHLIYPSASATVAVSEGVRRGLATAARLPMESITTVYNPVDCKAVREQSLQEVDLDLPSGVPLVVAVGRLHPDKRFDVLIQAISQLTDEPAPHLIIIGSGPEEVRLRGIAETLRVSHRVKLLGFLANPYPVLTRADVCALASRREGLPTVLLESLCLGVPFVATDCDSGPREILQAHPGRGQLVPVDDFAALVAALADATRAPRRHADRTLAKAFRPQLIVEEYEALLGLAETDADDRNE